MGELADGSFVTDGKLDGSDWEVGDVRYLSAPPKYPMKDEGEFFVEVIDDKGELQFVGFFTPKENTLVDLEAEVDFPRSYSFRIPAYDSTRHINIKDTESGDMQHQYTLDSQLAPEVSLLTELTGVVSSDAVIEWTASSPADKGLFYYVEYSHDRNDPNAWSPVGRELDRKSYIFNPARVRGTLTESALRVVASDGINYSFDESGPFHVDMKPPEISVSESRTLPQDDYYMQIGVPERFFVRVEGVDGEHIPKESIRWYSSKDGLVGNGQVYLTRNLSQGKHKVWVEVTALDDVVYTEEVVELEVVDKKPEIIVRVGDGEDDDLACNELEVDVIFPQAEIRELHYAFNLQKGERRNTVTSTEILPLHYQMTEPTRLNIWAIDKSGWGTRNNDLIPLQDCEGE